MIVSRIVVNKMVKGYRQEGAQSLGGGDNIGTGYTNIGKERLDR
jgi:hypothetical protein